MLGTSKYISKHSEIIELSLRPNADEIATMSLDDIREFSIRDKFQAIHNVQKRVLEANKAPVNDPFKPIPEDGLADEIRVLCRISETMRYTSTYVEWLNLTRQYLFARLCIDTKYQNYINRWDNLPSSSKKHALRLREKHHAAAAKQTSRTNITSTNIKFLDDDIDEEKAQEIACRIYGLSYGSIGGSKSSREIHISTHPKSSIQSAPRAMKTGHHEKTHDIGLQQGGMYAHGKFEALGA